ncbi:phosphotransferase family protein [Nocardiopsis oceani]
MEPTDTARALAARHGLSPEHVHPLPPGAANHVLALGPDLVLRIPRSPGFADDLRKEAALIPIAHRAGVRTPALVDFADPLDGPPYLLLERLPGTDLADREPAQGTLMALGRQLARVHRIPTTGLSALPRDHGVSDPEPLLERLRREGHIDAGSADWLRSWCEHLAARVPATLTPALVHGDVAPQNLVVTATGDLGGIVDWGDAALADAATDFAKLPPHWLPSVLEGYRDARGESAAHPWEARILWHHLTWALGRLADPSPQPGRRHWTAPPASRLLGLLRLFSSRPPAPWPDMAPPASPGL